MPEDSLGAMSRRGRGLRPALIGGALCVLGLMASMGPIGVLSWVWLIAMLGCLAYAWYSAQSTRPERVSVDDEAMDRTVGTPVAEAAFAETREVAGSLSEDARLLSSAGHDMRQPLQAISLFSATLATHPLPHESSKLVEGIEQAAEALSALFEAVMAVARLSSGRVEFHRQEVALGCLLQQCVAHRMEVAEEKGLHLRHVPTSLFAWADQTQLAHVIDILIQHSLVTSEGGTGIVIGCRRQAASVRIEVWDNGRSLSAVAMGELFEPFSDYGQALADRGLGLVLARRLMRAMGGDLTVGRSDRAKGKRLVIHLPS